VGESISYEDTIKILRAALVAADGNAWAFQVRWRGQPKLLSERSWRELADIEKLLGRSLAQALRQELRVAPWTYRGRIQARWRGIVRGLANERWVVARLYQEFSQSPVESWRREVPQLETTLWPFFVARTHYGANTLALALDQPAPFPALIWHPGRQDFQRG
jgi:hypothetical protein